MDDILEVEVSKATFAKELNYFLSFQLNDGGEKLRTEVAEASSHPTFKNNTFKLPLGDVLSSPRALQRDSTQLTLRIGGFVIIQKDSQSSSKPSLLGSGSLDVKALLKQLEGGKKILCDDIALTRKSRKPGQEEQSIVVGKVQLFIRFVRSMQEERDFASPEPSIHPDARVCKVLSHLGRIGRGPKTNRRFQIEARVISSEAHQALMAFREDIDQRETWQSYWPKALARTRGGKQRGNDTVFEWGETTVLRVEQRALERSKGLRIDLVESPVEDLYDENGKLVSPRGENWSSVGGSTLAFDYLHRLKQYNLELSFSNKETLLLSVEMFPSFHEEWELFSNDNDHNNSENLRRIQFENIRFTEKLGIPITSGIFARIAGDPEYAHSSAAYFHKCKPLVNPTSSEEDLRQVQFQESSAQLDSYPWADQCAKVTPFLFDNVDQPQWTNLELAFNAQGKEFETEAVLDLFNDEFVKLGTATVDLTTCPMDGSLCTINDLIVYRVSSVAEQPESVNGDEVSYEPISKCSLEMRIWGRKAYRKELEKSLEETPIPINNEAEILAERQRQEKALKQKKKEEVLSQLKDELDSLSTGRQGSARIPTDEDEVKQEEESSPKPPTLDFDALVATSRSVAKPPKSSKRNPTVEMEDPRVEKPQNSARLAVQHAPTPELTPVPSRNSTPLESPFSAKSRNQAEPGGQRDDESILSPSRAASRVEHQRTAHEVKLLEERIGILSADLNNKQALIDRLLSEIDKRSEAIRSCGTEIVQLRKENHHLAEERDQAFQKLQQMEQQAMSEAHTLSNAENVDGIDPRNIPEMKRRISLLGQKYLNERKRNEEILQRLVSLQKASVEHRRLLQNYEKLEKAHGAQARYIQELQEENAQLGLFRATIKTQEKVILKLEDLLESKLREGGAQNQTQLVNEVRRLQERNEELERKILDGDFIGDESLQARVHELEQQLEDARAQGPETNDEEAQEKIKALEEQLVNNAKSFAKEISEVKMKLFEYEAVMEANEA